MKCTSLRSRASGFEPVTSKSFEPVASTASSNALRPLLRACPFTCMHASTQWSRRAANPVESKSFEREWARDSSISCLERERTRGSSISVLELWRHRKREFSRNLEVWRPRMRDFSSAGGLESEISREFSRSAGLEGEMSRAFSKSGGLEVARKPGSSRGLAFFEGFVASRELLRSQSR